MQEQGIPFYRFNPQLDEVIPSSENDLAKLVNMLIKVFISWCIILLASRKVNVHFYMQTKIYITNSQEQGLLLLDELVRLFHLVAAMNRKNFELKA